MKYLLWREWKREIGWLILRLFRWITRQSIRNCESVLLMLDKTEAELEKTKKELAKAQEMLKDIKHLATHAAKAGASVLSDEGVPRGNWAYAKAQNEVGNGILKALRLKQYKPSQFTAKRIFKKLFM